MVAMMKNSSTMSRFGLLIYEVDIRIYKIDMIDLLFNP